MRKPTTSTRITVVPPQGTARNAVVAVLGSAAVAAVIALAQSTVAWRGGRAEFLVLAGVTALLSGLTALSFVLRADFSRGSGAGAAAAAFAAIALHFLVRLAVEPLGLLGRTLYPMVVGSWVATQLVASVALMTAALGRYGSRRVRVGLLVAVWSVSAGGGAVSSAVIGRWAQGPSLFSTGLVGVFLISAVLLVLAAFRGGGAWDGGLTASCALIAVAHGELAWSTVPYDAPFMWGHVALLLAVAIPLAVAVVENAYLLRQQVEAAARMRRLRRRFEVLLDSLPAGVLTVEAGNRLRYANRTAARLLGTPVGFVEGIDAAAWSRRIHRSGLPQLTRAVENALADGTEWQGVCSVLDAEGGVRWLNVDVHPASDPLDERPLAEVVATDVTDVVLARRSAEQREETLSLLADLAQTVAGETGLTRILERFLGRIRERIPVKAIRLYRPTLDGSQLTAELEVGAEREVSWPERVPAGSGPCWEAFADGFPRAWEAGDGVFLYVPLLAAGSAVGVLAMATRVRVNLEQETANLMLQVGTLLGGAVYLAQLVEELNHQRALALQASRLKSEFLANTSHELRTPLTSILGFLRLILDGSVPDGNKQLEFLEIAYQSAERLLAIINDVLDLAKIEAGRLEVHPREVTVAPVLAEVERLFVHQMRNKGIRFQTARAADELTVWADPDRFRQILTNLLSNALKFTPRGGRIEVRVVPKGEHVVFEVQDTGAGIAPEELERVFESFYQVDGSTTRETGGTGLGLTISRRLAEMMGGALELESAGPGHGTVARLVLPRSSPADRVGKTA